MKDSLNIVLIQTDTLWEDIERNLSNLTKKLNLILEKVDIIVLPELFSTGFTMNAKHVVETMNGKSILWMLEKAKEKNSLLIGSLLISDTNLKTKNFYYYNRLVVAFPNGELQYYDKRHLFSFAGEEKVFTSGNKRLVFEYKGFKICPLICYDLRFPVWARNTENIDVLIYVANWPNARIYAWDALLRARAIENLCYVVGVNRVGVDNNELVYSGHSGVYNTLGEKILDFKNDTQEIKEIRLQKSLVDETRKKFSFLDDRDEFEIKQ